MRNGDPELDNLVLLYKWEYPIGSYITRELWPSPPGAQLDSPISELPQSFKESSPQTLGCFVDLLHPAPFGCCDKIIFTAGICAGVHRNKDSAADGSF